MPIKFIDLRDTTGRQSSIGLVDGKGASPAGVEIVGVLPHMTAFTFEEFDRFARAYLAARADSESAVDDALDLLGRHLQDDDNSAHDALDVLRQAFHASLARLAS